MHYYMHDGPDAFRFELAGGVDADAAARLEQDWRTAASAVGKRTVIVDLSFVTAIDEAARSLFRRWHAAGVQFAAISAQSRELVEAITGVPFRQPPPRQPTYAPWFSLGARSFSMTVPAIPVLLLFTSLFIPSPAWAADNNVSRAFARYVTSSGMIDERGGDTVIEIDAALPKLGKQGRLDAVRHLDAGGHAEYLIVRFDGDATVKREVIARYLSLEQEASTLPASALAITPENYKFRYTGSIAQGGEQGGEQVYVFTIKPRHRSAGLIQGQIWIDPASGAAVPQEGNVVKSKSIFVREIRISRDSGSRVTSPYFRTTHVDVETRWFGPAELIIRERPTGLQPKEPSKSTVGELR